MNLIYENARARIALAYDERDTVIMISKLEACTDYYFSFFRPKHTITHSNSTLAFTNTLDLLLPQKIQSQFIGEVSDKAQLLSLLPFVVFSLLLFILPVALFPGEMLVMHGCRNFQVYIPIDACLIMAVLMLPAMLFSVYFIEDGLSMRNEFMLGTSLSLLLLIPYLLGFFIPEVSPAIFGTGIYALIISYMTLILSTINPIIRMLLHQRAYSKLGNSRLEFESILKNYELFKDLKTMMVKELCIENALFIEELHRKKTTRAIKKSNLDLTRTPKQKLWSVYNKYIRDGACLQLNIPQELNTRMRVCLESRSEYGYELFDPVYEEVLKMVFENTYQRYVLESKRLRKIQL